MTGRGGAGYDIAFHQYGISLEPHFCREWGCYGTNPDHGYTLDDACKQMAEWHEQQAAMWRNKTHPDIQNYEPADPSPRGGKTEAGDAV